MSRPGPDVADRTARMLAGMWGRLLDSQPMLDYANGGEVGRELVAAVGKALATRYLDAEDMGQLKRLAKHIGGGK